MSLKVILLKLLLYHSWANKFGACQFHASNGALVEVPEGTRADFILSQKDWGKIGIWDKKDLILEGLVPKKIVLVLIGWWEKVPPKDCVQSWGPDSRNNPITAGNMIGSAISRLLTISRSDRIPRTMLATIGSWSSRSCLLRWSVLNRKFHHNNWSFYQQYHHN